MDHLYNECSMCHHKGLRPGILDTKHGDYGIRDALKQESDLALDEYGLCYECAKLVKNAVPSSNVIKT
jgi:hypothetical protein